MTAQLFKLIRKIQIETNRLAQDVLMGSYRSAFKGQGLEFHEVREYQPGDEVRNIDWHVTSRMNHPYIKIFREERELSVILVVDISASSRFGTQGIEKSSLIAEIGATIAFSVIKNNDKVGLLLFSDHVEKYLPPRKSLRHVLRVIRELLIYQPKGRGTDVSSALSFLGKVEAKGSICFLISDFICPDFSRDAALIAKKHDLIGIGIRDPGEINLPSANLVQFQDLESGEQALVDTSDPKVLAQFQKQAQNRRTAAKHLFNAVGGGFIDIQTNKPFLFELKKFFKLRSKHPR